MNGLNVSIFSSSCIIKGNIDMKTVSMNGCSWERNWIELDFDMNMGMGKFSSDGK